MDDTCATCSTRLGSQPSAGVKVRILEVTLLAFILLQQSTVIGENRPTIQSETLLRSSSSWDGKPYAAYPTGRPELSVLKITIPPHTALKWHNHPMPNAACPVRRAHP